MKYREIWKVYSKVFDRQTFKNLEALEKAGYLKEPLVVVSEGKEAVVFRAESSLGYVAVKIYKVMNISYRKQYEYLLADPRFQRFPRTRIGTIYTWVKKEFSNLTRLYKSMVNVPMPIAFRGNVLVMEWIGDETPAPQLKDVYTILDQEFFKKILNEYMRFVKKAKLVHGDLSEYNILVYRKIPYIIDVSQAIPFEESTISWLERDLKNLVRMSKKFGVSIDVNELKELFYTEKGNPAGPYS